MALACHLLLVAATSAAAQDLLIRNARLIDGTGAAPRERVSIRIRAGRIHEIAPDLEPLGEKVLDVEGSTVLPGLVDSRVFLSAVPGSELRGDTETERRHLLAQHLRAYVACGVTTVLDHGMDGELRDTVREHADATGASPRVLTLGRLLFTPPQFASEGWQPVQDAGDVSRRIDDLTALGAVGAGVLLERGWIVRLLSIPAADVREAIAGEASARGLPIHLNATAEADQMLGLTMRPRVISRQQIYRRGLPSDAFIRRVVEQGAYQTATFGLADASLAVYEPDRLDDPLLLATVPAAELETARAPETWQRTIRDRVAVGSGLLPSVLKGSVATRIFNERGERLEMARLRLGIRKMHEAGVPVIVGSEAGISPYAFHGISTLRTIEILGEAGISPSEAIAAGTRVPAEMLELDDEIGTVEVGKRADLFVVAGDPLESLPVLRRIEWTVLGGTAKTPGGWMGHVSPGIAPREGPALRHPLPPTSRLLAPNLGQIAVAVLYGLPVVVWATIAGLAWRSRQVRYGVLLPVLAALMTLQYLTGALSALLWVELYWWNSPWLEVLALVIALTTTLGAPVLRHVTMVTTGDSPATRRWLVLNYGAGAAMTVVLLVTGYSSVPTGEPGEVALVALYHAYLLTIGLLILRDLWPLVRPGSWRVGFLAERPYVGHLALLGGGGIILGGLFALWLTGGILTPLGALLHVLSGLVIALPFTLRVLREVVRGIILYVAAVALVGCAYGLVLVTQAEAPGSAARMVVGLVGLLGIALIALTARPVLAAAIDRLVLRRAQRRRTELRTFVASELSGELGVEECARRSVAALTEILGFRGAALLLQRGDSYTRGIELAPLDDEWLAARAAGALPDRPMIGWLELGMLSRTLRAALASAEVIGIVRVVSPRAAWGHLLLRARWAGAGYASEDVRTILTFASQLALTFDAAELIKQAVASERLRYEEVAALNASLDARIKERTAELEEANQELSHAYGELKHAEAELVQSEKMASLGRLVAGVAHEINNPVSFITTSIAPLRRRIEDATTSATGERDRAVREVGEIIALIERGAERTAAIVNDLRAFSRVDQGERKPVDLKEGIEVSARLLAARWGERIVLHRDYGPVPPVECDAGQVNQVFMNLLANAGDAIPGRGNVWVTTRSEGSSVRVSIRDDGAGMSAETLQHVFEPFFTTKDVGEGAGLGLAISHGIVVAHGGRIEVASEPGRGSRFDVVLPVQGDAVAQEGQGE